MYRHINVTKLFTYPVFVINNPRIYVLWHIFQKKKKLNVKHWWPYWLLLQIDSLPQNVSTTYPENNFQIWRLNTSLTNFDKETHCKPLEIENLDIFLDYCEEIGLKSAKNTPGGPFQIIN